MDYLLLQTFLAVIEAGSFSKAAETMNCVQSNITARIKRLEEHFGKALFERGRGGARTTVFGAELELQAKRLLAVHQQAEQELMRSAGKAAKFRLGSMETTAGARLPPLLKWLSDQCPDTPLSLHTATTGELTSLVWDRRLDAALVAGPVDQTRFHCVPAFHEKLVLASPVKGQKRLPLLAFRNSCTYRNMAVEWLRATGKSDTQIIEMGTLDGMLGCVDAGMGFAIFPESAVQTYRQFDNVQLTALPPNLSDITTFLIWRYDHQPGLAHNALLERLSSITG